MSWKVLITAKPIELVGQDAADHLRERGCELVVTRRPLPLAAADVRAELAGLDAVLAGLDDFSAPVLGSAELARLKIISRWGVGYDRIDVPAATRLGIAIGFTPGQLDNAVGDYTWALLMAVARGVHTGHAAMLAGNWKPIWGADIAGRTLGIIGTGRIGQVVARRAAGFEMRLLGHDVRPNPAAEALGMKYVPLDELLVESDFVSLNCALTPETRGMIGEAQLRRMKPSAFLINTARGALVDEGALVRACAENWIAGAALDAFVTEPLPGDHPLRMCPNVLLTPHQAPNARATGANVSLAAARNITALLRGETPPSLVNPEVLDSPNLRARAS